MTQPNPGDFVPLGGRSSMPGVSTPRSGAGDANVGTGSSTASVVQVELGAWEARAEAANWAAEELRECSRVVGQVLLTNYFGRGCAEGDSVFEALKAALNGTGGWKTDLALQIAAADTLAKASTGAAKALSESDSAASSSLERAGTIAT